MGTKAMDNERPAVRLEATGDWTLRVEVTAPALVSRMARPSATLTVTPPERRTVNDEFGERIPLFDRRTSVWCRGYRLAGLRTQETMAKGQLMPGSVELRRAADGRRLMPGTDYLLDEEWGTLNRPEGGTLGGDEPVYISYRYGLSRLDSVVLTADARLDIRLGVSDVTAPRPPVLEAGEIRLANIGLRGYTERLGDDNLFPILEDRYPESASPSPRAASMIPQAYARLVDGGRLRILAWGDSVTVGSYLTDPADRWQEQWVARLRRAFPKADIELYSEAWGGRDTATYLAEPPGAEHNFNEKVLAVRPDLIVSEFVNDGGMNAAAVDERYGRILADFRRIGAEWIILTPHYVMPEWMGLTRVKEIDDDPREYVRAIRRFAEREGVGLADASRRWGRLWRQGIPYMTLMLNAINHPDERGMAIFADSLMALFA